MARTRDQTYGQQRITLQQTLLVAVLLHLMLAGVATWQPELLWSVPALEPVEESRPLEFRFVDVPDVDPPEEAPDTEALSDRDRVARDMADAAGAEEPFSEGNTSQEVLRSELAPEEAPPQPLDAEATPPTEPTPVPAEAPVQPPAETTATPPETPEETAEAEADARAETAEPSVAEETPETAAPVTAGPPAALPPPTPALRSTMARLNSFVDRETLHRPDGGSDEQGLVSFDTKGYDLGEYINRVIRIIERNWKSNIPDTARLPGMEGATFVQLSIERVAAGDGSETARIVVHRTWTSGKRSFDQAAVFALDISNPLPPIPEFFPYESLDGRIGFLYNLRPDQVTFPPGG